MTTTDAAAEAPQKLLTPAEVADLLGVSERTLEGWRRAGGGPGFLRLSRHTVRYRAEAVQDFLRSRDGGGGG
jgi:excisionase family DNA binding protein